MNQSRVKKLALALTPAKKTAPTGSGNGNAAFSLKSVGYFIKDKDARRFLKKNQVTIFFKRGFILIKRNFL